MHGLTVSGIIIVIASIVCFTQVEKVSADPPRLTGLGPCVKRCETAWQGDDDGCAKDCAEGDSTCEKACADAFQTCRNNCLVSRPHAEFELRQITPQQILDAAPATTEEAEKSN